MTTRTDTPEHPGDMPNPESTTPEQLRTWAEKVNKRNKALETEAVGRSLSEIGLKPDEGLGKAIAREYKGDVSAAAVSQYAKDEYGYQKPDPAPEANGEPGGKEPESSGEAQPEANSETPPAGDPGDEGQERREAIAAQQDAAAQAMAQGSQPKPETQADKIAAHDQKLAEADATRPDAIGSLTDKLAAYRQDRPL